MNKKVQINKGFSLLEMLVTLLIISLGLVLFNQGRLQIYSLQKQQKQQFTQILLQVTRQSINDVAQLSVTEGQLQQLFLSRPDCNDPPKQQCNAYHSCTVNDWAYLDFWEVSCQQ